MQAMDIIRLPRRLLSAVVTFASLSLDPSQRSGFDLAARPYHTCPSAFARSLVAAAEQVANPAGIACWWGTRCASLERRSEG